MYCVHGEKMTSRVGWLRPKLPESGVNSVREIARGLGAAAIAMASVLAAGASGRAILDPGAQTPDTATMVTIGHEIPTSDVWTERLADPAAWRGGRYVGDRRGRRSTWADDEADEQEFDDEDRPPQRASFYRGTYRTVCVRLCDGYFFPISFATTPERFSHDAAACQSRCATSPARLYVYPNPGAEPEQMVDLNGKPYSELKSAFLFRTNYDAACTCKPQPWSKEALARHRAYADAAKSGTQPRIVARTIRPEQDQADVSTGPANVRPRTRPEGAMLLGRDRPQPPPRTTRRAEREERPATRRGGTYGRRDDWQSRAFGGY
jgi:hypothetical protein